MKKKGQYSYSYHENKLCEKLERGAKLLQHKIFSRVKWFRSCCVTTIRNCFYVQKVYVILSVVFWVKGRVATNSLTTLPSLNKKIYSFITFQKLSSASNFEVFLHFLNRDFKIYKDVKYQGSKVLRNHQKVSIKSKQEKISNNQTISILVHFKRNIIHWNWYKNLLKTFDVYLTKEFYSTNFCFHQFLF